MELFLYQAGKYVEQWNPINDENRVSIGDTWISHVGNENNFENEAYIGTTQNHYIFKSFMESLYVTSTGNIHR